MPLAAVFVPSNSLGSVRAPSTNRTNQLDRYSFRCRNIPGTEFYWIVNVAVDAEVWPELSSITVILTNCLPGSVFDKSNSKYT